MEHSVGAASDLEHWDFSLLEPVPPNLLAPAHLLSVKPTLFERQASSSDFQPPTLPSPVLRSAEVDSSSMLQFDLDASASDVESTPITPYLGPAKAPFGSTPKDDAIILALNGLSTEKEILPCGLHRCTSETAHAAALQRRHSIEQDLVRMFPDDPLFQPSSSFLGILRQLVETVCNFVSTPGRSPYMQGLSYLCAGFLLHMDIEDAFVCMINLLERNFFQGALVMNADMISLRFQAFSLVLEFNFPKIHSHFEQLHLPPDCYLLDWLVTLFSRALPRNLTACVWDRILLHDELHTFKIAAALVQLLQDRLLISDAMVCQRLLRSPLQESLDTPIQQGELLEAIDSIQLPDQLKLQQGQLFLTSNKSSSPRNKSTTSPIAKPAKFS